ncbi:MAG: hypothetical protein ABI687_11605 [Flavitalea sp.]
MPLDPYKFTEQKLLQKIIAQVPEALAYQARIKFRRSRGHTKADLSSLPEHLITLINEKMKPQ